MLAIPTWERRLSYAVWISHSLAAFFIAYQVSHGSLSDWIAHWLKPSPYISGAKYDSADAEWMVFRKSLPTLLLANFLHSVAFFVTIEKAPKNLLPFLLLLFGIVGQIWYTSLECIVVIAIFGTFTTAIVYFTRSKVLAYVICIGFVCTGTELVPFSFSYQIYYREFNIYLYGAIKVLNFCLYLCSNPTTKYKNLWREHLAYMGYLPYSMSLIVLFEDFQFQYRRRLAGNSISSARSVILFGCRVAFWYFFCDFFLHVLFVHSIYHSPFTVIGRLGIYSMCSVSYVTGQFFHVKYVVIFGLPSFFAYLDGMTPPPPPICISRVSRYSRMWRHFDCGLYQFLKNQIYIPIMKPSLPPILSILRAFVSLVAVFAIVIAWHGTKPHYFAWVTLSAIELIIERIGRALWSTQMAEKIRKRVGPQNSRRIIALSMLFTVIPGIFGVFFFLGEDKVGETVFTKVLIAGLKDGLTLNIRWFDTTSAGFIFIHLLVLGYFFNNVCLDLDGNNSKLKVD